MRTQGKITHWNEEKGYGFITPSSGANQVFVHIRAFRNRHLQPELNQVVLYSLSTDNQGRPCAVKVTRASEIPSGNSKSITRLFLILGAIGFIAVVAWSISAYKMPIYILYLYLAASSLAHKGKHTAYIGADRRLAWRAARPTDVAAQVAERCFPVCVLGDGCF